VLNLRTAVIEDCDLILAWRNEPAARAASFTTDLIQPDEHRAWFAAKLSDRNCLLLIVEEDGESIGHVRLDRLDPDLAEVSIVLANSARGRGIGREALRRSVVEAIRTLGVKEVKARVKRGNAASLAAFTAAGFHVVSDDGGAIELLGVSSSEPPTR